MAGDQLIDARLRRWAQWLTTGDGSGYSTMSVLHIDWSPPSPGQTPTLKTSSRSDARETHRAVAALSLRLRNTLVVHYCMDLKVEEQALRLDCATRTVHERVATAHRLLAGVFATCSD